MMVPGNCPQTRGLREQASTLLLTAVQASDGGVGLFEGILCLWSLGFTDSSAQAPLPGDSLRLARPCTRLAAQSLHSTPRELLSGKCDSAGESYILVFGNSRVAGAGYRTGHRMVEARLTAKCR